MLFSTSWISKHALDLMRKELSALSIPVEENVLYVRNKPSQEDLLAAETFAKSFLS